MYRRRRRRRRRRMPTLVLILLIALAVGAFLIFFYAGGKSSYRKGMKAFENGRYEQAESYLEKAISKKSNNRNYRYAYGMTLLQNGQYDEAINQFERVISEKDTKKALKLNKETYRGMGICYFFAKNYENSIHYFDAALEINELYYINVDILKYKAQAETYLGNYESAIEIYSEIIKEDGYSSDMYLKRAYSYVENDNVADAVADYDYVIEKDEDAFDAYLGAYSVLMKEEEDEKADSYLEAALKIEPDTTDEKLKYAVIQYYYYGITEEAVASLETLVEEGEPEGYFYLAKISYAEGDFDQVSSYLNSYVSAENIEHLAEAYEMLGRSAMLKKDYTEALKWFETGIACNDIRWTQTLKKDQIAVYEYLSDFAKAYEVAKEYLADFPDDQNIKRELEFIKTRLSKNEME